MRLSKLKTTFVKLSLKPKLKLRKSKFDKAPLRKARTNQLPQPSPNLLQPAR